MKKNKTNSILIKVFWVFFIGCLLGYIMEVLFHLYRTHEFQTRQGLIYGPFAPVYGLGMVSFYLILPKLINPKPKKYFEHLKEIGIVFLVSANLGGLTEYLCSYFQEKWFGTVSWDYSNLFMNLHGRTSIIYCILWGFLGIVFIKLVYPYIEKGFKKFNFGLPTKILTAVAIVFMIFNISISSMAAQRQLERREHIGPKNEIDEFLDEHYPDELMNRVYANKIEK